MTLSSDGGGGGFLLYQGDCVGCLLIVVESVYLPVDWYLALCVLPCSNVCSREPGGPASRGGAATDIFILFVACFEAVVHIDTDTNKRNSK